MKARLVLLFMAMIAISFISCDVDEPIDESQKRGVQVERPFKMRSSGTFQIVTPVVCDEGLVQVLIEGQGKGTLIGNFSVTITYCTDFGDIHILNGYQIAANGDQLFFYNIGGGEDENGFYNDYYYYSGTGRFENVSGTLRLYGVFEFTGPTSGVFSNQGEGTLTY
ncbi:MAG: hypothetical protein KJO00_07260 [Bacteroidia bacterium]|nr:hypothetical protein [Bacteroidia bacterium]